MKQFKVTNCPVYDLSGLCSKYKQSCKLKRACPLKKTLHKCMEKEDDIFNPLGYQNKYIISVMGVRA